jgi:hypothetical protein
MESMCYYFSFTACVDECRQLAERTDKHDEDGGFFRD